MFKPAVTCRVLAGLAFCLAAAPASAGLYGLSSSTNGLYTINPLSGAATLVGDTGGSVSLSGLSFADGILYGTDIFGLGPMARLDTMTGAGTPFSDQGGSINWHGLGSVEDGPLYTIDIDDGSILKSISTGGVITSIGSGAGIDGRGMAYDDGNGVLYATGGTSLYSVDTGLGTSTIIGDMGLSTGLFGLAYDEMNGILYGNSGDTHNLYRIDVMTGAATLIGANGVDGIDGLAWIDGNMAPVPVPAALPLLGTGVAVLGYFGWRRRSV